MSKSGSAVALAVTMRPLTGMETVSLVLVSKYAGYSRIKAAAKRAMSAAEPYAPEVSWLKSRPVEFKKYVCERPSWLAVLLRSLMYSAPTAAAAADIAWFDDAVRPSFMILPSVILSPAFKFQSPASPSTDTSFWLSVSTVPADTLLRATCAVISLVMDASGIVTCEFFA